MAKAITGEQHGQFRDRVDDFVRQVKDGSIEYADAMVSIQAINTGKGMMKRKLLLELARPGLTESQNLISEAQMIFTLNLLVTEDAWIDLPARWKIVCSLRLEKPFSYYFIGFPTLTDMGLARPIHGIQVELMSGRVTYSRPNEFGTDLEKVDSDQVTKMASKANEKTHWAFILATGGILTLK